MKLTLEMRFLAERLGLKIRWAVTAAAVLLLYDRLDNPFVLAFLVAFSLANMAAHRLCGSPEAYGRSGMRFMGWLRLADGVAVTGLAFTGLVPSSNLWLLGIPVLISEGMVTRSKPRVGRLGAILVAILLAGCVYRGWALPSIGVAAGLLALGAVVALVLARFQAREEVLTSHDMRLGTVLDCGAALAASSDLRATMLHTLKSGVLETQASCGYVMLLEEEEDDALVAEVAYGAEGDFEFPNRLEFGAGMSGYVAKMGQPVAISDSGEEEHEFDGMTAGVRSAASVPLIARTQNTGGQASAEQVLGVMTLLNLHSGSGFEADDMELLRTLGSLLAVAVANARMEERQQATFLQTMESLATALEARDQYTQGHSQRVCEVSMMIGENMGLSTAALEELRVGTILHDIGKIGVPDAILNKPGRLTDEEFAVMKTHPVIGYEICKPLRLSEGVLMIIRNHHEKLDGSGYPDGLKGGELPLSLRIVCVADAFDAMSSRRAYRDVMDPQAVLAELSKGAGTQFDPVVVENLKILWTTDRMVRLYQPFYRAPEEKVA